MRRTALVLVPLLVASGLVAAAPAAVAQHPGANGEITSIDQFVWSGGTRPDGTFRACCDPFPDATNPDKPLVAPEQAVWGPDGRTVAVVGTWVRDGGPGANEVLIYDSVGDELRSIGLADDSRPDFSPDGSHLVLARDGDLVVVDVATGLDVRPLTTTPGVAERDPSWSPDGATIAFATAEGVSFVPAAGGAATPAVAGAGAPQFAGDGEHLAYLKDGELVVAAADGTGGASTGVPAYSYTWAPDSTAFAGLVELAVLGDAWQSSDTWVFSVDGQPVRAIGGGSSAGSFSWQPVQAPQPVVVAPTSGVSGSSSAFSRSSTLTVRWTASDLVSPVVSTDVRYRRASALGGPYTSYRWWINRSTSRTAALAAVPGYRYCFSSRARNEAGAQSAWSDEKCTTVPFDDRQLTARGDWVRVSRQGFLRETASRTTDQWASLSAGPGYVREVGVIASTGPNGGRVAVLVGSRRIGTISLVSATAKDRTLLMLPRLAQGKYGSVRLVVLTSGKTVRIDGLAISAR